MKNIRRYLWLGLFCLIAAGAHGQQKYDHIAAVGLNAPIFRSEVAQRYMFDMEGIVYAYSNDFEAGRVVYNGKEYWGVLLNLNSHRDELQLKVKEVGINLSLKKSLVESFEIGRRKFVNLQGENVVRGLKEGYYEVLHEGEHTLLKKHWKSVVENNDMITGTIRKKFVTKSRYYLVVEGKASAVKDSKGLASHFKERKGAMKEYMKLYKGFPEDDMMQGLMEIAEKGEVSR